MPKQGYPLFLQAPGHKVRKRADGTFVCYWIARYDLVKKGYLPRLMEMWRGTEPSVIERELISSHCQDLQDDMLHWDRERRMRLPAVHESMFDGTVKGLIRCYVHDADSPYRNLEYGSRQSYYQFLRVIENDHGSKKIADLKGRDMLGWHREWTPRGVAMSHGLIKHFRGLLTFGKTILDDADCTRLSSILHSMKFKMGRRRTETMTAEQVIAVRNRARAIGLHSVALAQVIQFESMMRQRDVIGQWVPLKEPGMSDIIHGDMKWIKGVRWEEFDESLLMRHVTSKRKKPLEFPFGEAPLFMEEMKLRASIPTSGPVIICEETGRPWLDEHFRRVWRRLANECGIPKHVQNRDTRASAATEADEAGADAMDIKEAATHSDLATTQIYIRRPAAKVAKVLRLRNENRNKA